MQRTALTSAIVLSSLVFLLMLEPLGIQAVNATAETFELVPEAGQGHPIVYLQVGDHVEGSFKLSNIGPYLNLLTNNMQKVRVNVAILDPEGKAVANFTHTSGGSFKFTATSWGDYSISIFCDGIWCLKGASNPVITLDFQVTKAKLPHPPDPDLMAWWKLDEGKGTAVLDYSWHNLQGTIHGGNWTKVNGNNFLNFNGTSDYVRLPTLPADELDELTVSAWINSDFTKNGQIYFHGSFGNFQLGNGDFTERGSSWYSRYANFSVKLLDDEWYSVYSSSPMTPNTWHHIVGVWVKGTSLKMYVDGVLAGENDKIAPDRLFILSGNPGSIGVESPFALDNPCYFKGEISNVMVYNKALSSQEVDNLTSQIAASLSIPKPTPVPEQEHSSTLPVGVGVAAGALIAIISLCTLVYFKKFRIRA
jgi:hypothetical protein